MNYRLGFDFIDDYLATALNSTASSPPTVVEEPFPFYLNTPSPNPTTSAMDTDYSTTTTYHPYRRSNSIKVPGENTGRWTAEEHELFLKGLKKYGKVWKDIASVVPTRTVVQIRTHAQKYLQKLARTRSNSEHCTNMDTPSEPTTSRARSNTDVDQFHPAQLKRKPSRIKRTSLSRRASCSDVKQPIQHQGTSPTSVNDLFFLNLSGAITDPQRPLVDIEQMLTSEDKLMLPSTEPVPTALMELDSSTTSYAPLSLDGLSMNDTETALLKEYVEELIDQHPEMLQDI